MLIVHHRQNRYWKTQRIIVLHFVVVLVTLVLGLLPIKSIADSNEEKYTQALKAYNTKNYETALAIWRTLASEGNADAQYALGVAYFKGEGVTRNLGESLNWFQMAATAGNPQAMFNLGAAHWEGNGTHQSYADAVDWWEKAAEAGQHAAQYNLGLAYYLGKGAEQDFNQALKWIRRAADNDHMGALQVLKVMEKEIIQRAAEPINGKTTIDSNNRKKPEPNRAAEDKPDEPEIISTDYQSATVSNLGGQAYPEQNSKGAVLANLSGGTPVKVLLVEENWAKVNVPGVATAWVYGKYVKNDSDQPEIRGNRVRARSLPSTGENSIILGTFEDSERLIVLNERDGWAQVIAPPRIPLWMPTEHLQDYGDVTNVWLAQWRQAISNMADEPDSPSADHFEENTSGNGNQAHLDPKLPENGNLEPEQSFQAAIVSAASAEALGTDRLGAPLLKLLVRGTPVKVTAIRSSWAAVKIADPVNVWVYGKYVSQRGDVAEITGTQVRARSMPSTTASSTVLGIFEDNTPVRVISKEGDWIRVSSSNVATVWVSVSQLQLLDEISNEWSELWNAARN